MSINKLILTILTSGLIFLLGNQSFAQTKITKRKLGKRQPVATKVSKSKLSEEEKQEKDAEQMEKEAAYYAPIRYVVVYNDIFYHNPATGEPNLISLGDEEYQKAEKAADAQRRMEILMLPEQFNRQNLIPARLLMQMKLLP